jgi:uncharacterized protein YcfJ
VLGSAAADTDFYDYAPVLDAIPIVEEIEVPVQREHCQRVHVPARHGRYSYTPTIVGGIIGGAIGSQIGSGDRRRVAAIAGTLLGASIGNDFQHHHRRVSRRPVQRCEVIEEYDTQEQVVGYRVKYRYQGHTFVTRMTEDPGEEVRIRVSLRPATY